MEKIMKLEGFMFSHKKDICRCCGTIDKTTPHLLYAFVNNDPDSTSIDQKKCYTISLEKKDVRIGGPYSETPRLKVADSEKIEKIINLSVKGLRNYTHPNAKSFKEQMKKIY